MVDDVPHGQGGQLPPLSKEEEQQYGLVPYLFQDSKILKLTGKAN